MASAAGMFACEQCLNEFPIEQHCKGYGKNLCGKECFQEAGKTYKPVTDRNRGGGVGVNKVTI